MHRLASCEDREKIYCTNCKMDKHRASDRNCPIFQQECACIANRIPENKYKYFLVMEDPRSWVLVKGTTAGETHMGEMVRMAGTGWELRHLGNEGQARVNRVNGEGPQKRGWDKYNEGEPIMEEEEEDGQEEGWQMAGNRGILTRGRWRGGARGNLRGRSRTQGTGRAESRGQEARVPESNRTIGSGPPGTQSRLDGPIRAGKGPTVNEQTPNNG